jgi:leucyl aminopeptidase (aminopeptidase T)
MSWNWKMMKGARRLVEVCAAAKPGEKALIVADTQTMGPAQAIAAAAYERDLDVVLTQIPDLEIDETELPSMVAKAMQEADIVFMATVMGHGHTTATREALEHGARVLLLEQIHHEQMLTEGALFADFAKQRPEVRAFAQAFTEADEARVTSTFGTEIRMSLKGRTGNAHDCIVETPGTFAGVPNIEANGAPVEGSAEGVIVADGSLPHFGIGLLREPIRLTVRNGSVVKTEGGREARILERIWAETNDPNVYNIGQIAVGLNPEAKEVNGILIHDHGVYGSMHFGIGTSANLGGGLKATTHFDVIFTGASLWLDGVQVLDNGRPMIANWSKRPVAAD